MEKDWEKLELLVAQIQKELAPTADVQHNVRVMGELSGKGRQVDVLVRQRIGQYEMLVAIDCKDYKAPVDVKGVEEFHGLLDDIRAHKGALVCPSGFTRTAKKRAKHFGIELYRPVDTNPHKWQVRPAIPMICDFRSASIAFGISVSAPAPFRMSNEFYRDMQVFGSDGNALGTPLEAGLRNWNEGRYPTDPGEHDHVPIYGDVQTRADNGYGMEIPVSLYVSLVVQQRIYFGHLPIEKIRGLRNEQTGDVVTNAFTTGVLNPEEVEKHWRKLKLGESPPVTPGMRIVGLDCFDVSSL